MLEKLIENWLDSAGERTYQPIFCQMLLDNGYTVIHSTTHVPNEFGKDVIAIDSEGVPCLFQLKGNPGSRLTLSQYREIAAQLAEMVNHQIEHPAVPKGNHKSFLVTNGSIVEDVQQAIEQINAKNANDGYPHRTLQTISRDQLLSWALKLDASLWPSELDETKQLLEILTCAGNELFPLGKLHNLLSEIFKLNPEQEVLGKAEFSRRLSSAALLVGICLTLFSKKNNHWAIISAWSMFAIYVITAATKSNIPLNAIESTLLFIENVVFEKLIDLMKEVLYRNDPLVEGNKLADFAVFPWRKTLLIGISSFAWLWLNKLNAWPDQDFKKKLQAFIPHDFSSMEFWGEAAFPLFLFQTWAINAQGKGLEANALIENLLEIAMRKPLPAIYYDGAAVIKHNLSKILEDMRSEITQDLEGEVRFSWFARQLMMLMVQNDMKETCQKIWPEYTHLTTGVFLPNELWMYGLLYCELGNNMSYAPQIPESWDNLKKENEEEEPLKFIPQALLNRPWFLGIWLMICPQRAIPAAINYLNDYYKIPSASSMQDVVAAA